MVFLFPSKFNEYIVFCAAILTICRIYSTDSPTQTRDNDQTDLEQEYNAYYEESIKQMVNIEAKEESKFGLTLFQVLKPFFDLFFWSIVAIITGLVLFVVSCCLLSVDWNRMSDVIEWIPCTSHSRLSERFEQLRIAGTYTRDGKVVTYTPVAEEYALIDDIKNRLIDA